MKDLNAHVNECIDSKCSCRVVVRNSDKWCKRLTLGNTNTPWLHFIINKCGKLRWTCLVCNGIFKDPVPEGPDTQTVQFKNLAKHHGSHTHRERVAKILGDDDLMPSSTTPPKELFKELFRAFQKGDAPRDGYELKCGIIAFRKANMMLWCMDQGINDSKRELFSQCELLNLIRDERNGRMHLRYRSGASDMPVNSNYFGQSRGHAPDALGLTEATLQCFKALATSRAHCPEPRVKARFDQSLFDESCKKVEAISIDSAENEVVSATDMKDTGHFPNCKFILRDSAHCARRLMSRLWKADPELDFTWKYFMLLASLIQWSIDLRNLYAECCEEADDSAVTSKYSHMRAAKHRIETWLSPLSRSILSPSGLIMT